MTQLPAGLPPLLTVVVPCFNEERTLETLIRQVLEVPLPLEVIVVDDGSRDNSRQVLQAIAAREPRVKALLHERNQGKGAALATGFKHATGMFVIVQDADLEYDPREYPRLLAPALVRDADVVFGSRFLGQAAHRVLFYWHSVANGMLTKLSNMACDINLTDMETCYKLFRREVIQAIDVRETRFGVEPEVTAKVARMGCRVYEVGISYNGRSYEEGKKIGLKDAFRALYCIFRYGVLGERRPKPPRPPAHPVYEALARRLAEAEWDGSRAFAALLAECAAAHAPSEPDSQAKA
jgi:glycosyltransferase involved in cell wall biosynthesis